MSILNLLVLAIIIAAVVAIVLVALKAMGINPPAWAVQIGWIICIAAVAILAIRFVMSL